MHCRLLATLILSVLSAGVRAQQTSSPELSGAQITAGAPGEEAEREPSPEELAALAAARAAGDRVRACQAGLLATNEVIRALSQKAEEARRALHDLMVHSPAYHDLTQRIATADARLQDLAGRKGTNSVGRLNKDLQELRSRLAKDRRQLRLLELGEGLEGEEADRLKLAVAEATVSLTKALNTHEEVLPLLRAHNKAVAAYLKAARPPEPAGSTDPAAPVPPSVTPVPPSGSP